MSLDSFLQTFQTKAAPSSGGIFVEAQAHHVDVDGLYFTIQSWDNGRHVFGPAPWPVSADVPVKGTRVLVLFLGAGVERPWVIAGDIGPGPSSLSELLDVNVTGVLDDESVVWDTTTSKWIPARLIKAAGDTMTGDLIFPNNGGQMIRSADSQALIVLDSVSGNMALNTTGALFLQPDTALNMEGTSVNFNGNDMFAHAVNDVAISLASTALTGGVGADLVGTVSLTAVPYPRLVQVHAAALLSGGVAAYWDFYLLLNGTGWKRTRNSPANNSSQVQASHVLAANTAATYKTKVIPNVNATQATAGGGDLNYLSVSWSRVGV